MSRDTIIQSITSIKDKNGNLIQYDNITCEWFSSKYSSKKEPIWHLLIDNKLVSKHSNYVFCYTCSKCLSNHMISATQFLRRIGNGTERCYLCRNQDQEKRENQSIYMKSGRTDKKEPLILDLFQKRDKSVNLFTQQDDEYKLLYFKSHLTTDDFNRISKNIISLENGKYTNMEEVEFWPIFPSNNQMNFTSVCFNKNHQIIFKINQPILKCDLCDTTWRAKSLEKFKNDIKILCRDCTCVNKTYNIKSYTNILKEKILYQSKLELKFIRFCNDNSLIIRNGPKVKYQFNNKEHTYRVDFQVDNFLVEIKDNHIWHRQQVQSGKWGEKEKSAISYCHEHKLQFMMITPSTWELTKKLNKI